MCMASATIHVHVRDRIREKRPLSIFPEVSLYRCLYCSILGKPPLLGKCPCTKYQRITVAASYKHMEFICWVSAHRGQHRELYLSAHGHLPGTLRHLWNHRSYELETSHKSSIIQIHSLGILVPPTSSVDRASM